MTTDRPTAINADPFAEIRPYRDDEVPGVLARLRRDPEFANVLVQMRLPRLGRYCPPLARALVRLAVGRVLRDVRSVEDFQRLIERQLRPHMQKVATALTVSGIERLDRTRAHVYISNHRDIAMDPALVNLMLYGNGMDTVRIAIGDNLLTKPFASDLMRINKSFIVKRAPQGRREKLAAFQQLSAYIRHSVLIERCSIWIAQREGRAKDGIDATETAILKMLALSRSPGQGFPEALDDLHLVPVAISYEFDPCDRDKARELHAVRAQGEYCKSAHEDLQSIYRGIMGEKGAVHVAFGAPLPPGLPSAEAAAAVIDLEILREYRLRATNFAAYSLLYGADPRAAALRATLEQQPGWAASEQRFHARLADVPEAERDIFLAMYANPLRRRLELDT